MKRFAMRSVWNSDRPPAVEVVTKNVRGIPVEFSGSDGLEGFDIMRRKTGTFRFNLRCDSRSKQRNHLLVTGQLRG